MATDLTTQLQEIVSSTIETALSKSVEFHNTFKSPAENLANSSFIKIDTNFTYGENNLIIRYLINLPLSSMIFHGMMFEDYVCDEEITEESTDAVKEFISQLSGGLELSINGSELEDISGVKYAMGDMGIHTEESYEPLGNIFRFVLEIEEKPFDLFVDINDADLDFFETLKNSPEDAIIEESSQEEAPTEEDDISENEPIPDGLEDVLADKDEKNEDDESSPKEQEDTPEPQTDEQTDETLDETNTNEDENPQAKEDEETSSEEKAQDDEDKEDKEELSEEDKKKKKLKLVIIILGSLIGILIIAAVVMYFMGVFDTPEPEQKETNTTKVAPSKENLILAQIKNKQIDFKPSMINEKRLNKRLSLLTKYEILEDDIVEKFQQEEKERLYKLKIQKLEEFAKNNKEESLFKNKTRLETNQTIKKDLTDEKYLQEVLTFIKVDPIEYKNFQPIINEEKTASTSVSMCRDTLGKIDIYIGPMYLNLETNTIINAVRKKYPTLKENIGLINMTRKEFNRLCNF